MNIQLVCSLTQGHSILRNCTQSGGVKCVSHKCISRVCTRVLIAERAFFLHMHAYTDKSKKWSQAPLGTDNEQSQTVTVH